MNWLGIEHDRPETVTNLKDLKKTMESIMNKLAEMPYPKSIELTEIGVELVRDALEASDWKKEKHWLISMPGNTAAAVNAFQYNLPPTIIYYNEEGLKLEVKESRIKFSGTGCGMVDETADLITDADKLVALIEWIYEGGTFPLTLKGEKENG